MEVEYFFLGLTAITLFLSIIAVHTGTDDHSQFDLPMYIMLVVGHWVVGMLISALITLFFKLFGVF